MTARASCALGASHVIPVPRGMTPEDAWAEITTMGRLVEPDEFCSWATIECDGHECLGIDLAPNFRRFHNDVQVWP